MNNLLKELVICKFELTKALLNKKDLEKETLKEIKTNLLLIDNLRKEEQLVSSEQLKSVQSCALKIK